MTTDEKLDLMIALQQNTIAALGALKWGSGLVGGDTPKPVAPTPAETSANPGKYYKTDFDPMKGDISSPQVVELFDDPPRQADSEGTIVRPFVVGTYYQWAKADLPSFLRFYQHRNKFALNLNNLHPEQRALMGL
jgi:hypothetical protein